MQIEERYAESIMAEGKAYLKTVSRAFVRSSTLSPSSAKTVSSSFSFNLRTVSESGTLRGPCLLYSPLDYVLLIY